MQVLNGAIAAVLFNIIYDTILSQKLKWYALCPVIDSMNHRSSIQVRQPVQPCQVRYAAISQAGKGQLLAR